MESYTLPTPAYPSELAEISIALFTDLQDAASLRERLIKASSMQGDEGEAERKALEFAFLDGRMIASRDQLLTAAHQAILAAVQGELRTQTIHSELINNLNPTSNVAEGLRRFGIGSKSTFAVLVRIGPKMSDDQHREVQAMMQDLTKGKIASLDELEKTADMAALRKIFKLGKDENLSPALLTTLTASNKTVGVF